VWGTNNEAGTGFLDIHAYPYSDLPSSLADVLATPLTFFSELKAATAAVFATQAPGKPLPELGITEYNMICCEYIDTSLLMRRAVNLFFMADSIGALISNGFKTANAWAMVCATCRFDVHTLSPPSWLTFHVLSLPRSSGKRLQPRWHRPWHDLA
jgi:hypothetical protein